MSDPPPPQKQQQQQHSSNSRKRGYDHHECEEYRRNSTDGQGVTGTTAAAGGGGYDSRRGSRNLYDSSPPLKMHKDLPSHLLPQHPLQQKQRHRLLPQQREQMKRREQEEDPVSDYDSDIDNNNDELAPFPYSSSRYHQTNGNANSNSTRNSIDYSTHRSSSRADQSRSQRRAGMVQSMNNNFGLKSSPPPESHPTHRQEDSGRGDLSDEEHWSREDARREGFRRWKKWCRLEGFKNYQVSVSRLLNYVESQLLPHDRVQLVERRKVTTSTTETGPGWNEFVYSILETSIHPILQYGQYHRNLEKINNSTIRIGRGSSPEKFRYESPERGRGDRYFPSSGWKTPRQSTISGREDARSSNWEDGRYGSRERPPTRHEDRVDDHHTDNQERPPTRKDDQEDTRPKGPSRKRLATHDDWRGHRPISNTNVKQLDQESDYRDSRRRTSCEVTYHKGLKDGRRNSRDGLRYDDGRKDIHVSSSRDDVGIDIRRDSREDKRTNLRNDDRAPSRQCGYRGGPCYDDFDDARQGSREDYRYNSSTNASFDDPEEGRYGGVAGLFSRGREASRREHPLEPLESRRKSYSQDRRSSSRLDDARVPRRSSRQDDLEDQWKSDGQIGRKEERRESREVYLPKETNSSAFPPKPHHNKAKTPRSSLQKHGANGMDDDDVPPTSEGNDLANAQDRIADSGDEEPEESLLSLLKRRRRLSQRTPISPTASEPPKTTSATAPSSSSTLVVATTPTTSTSISTANPASGENVVCVSTKDSCPAYSFTLGRYKASEFVIHSAQHKDGPFTNKYRPLPDFCRNVIDVLEVWRYGTKTFTAVQDLTEKFGRSWIAPKDRERYQFFTEAVQEFKRLVMEEAMDDDQAVKELMGQQDWRLIPLSKPQTDEEAELSPEGEPMDTDSDSDFVSQPRCRSNKSQSGKKSQSLKRPELSKRSESRKRSEWSKKSPAVSTDMDMDMDLDMDMDIGSTTANRTVAEEHSTSSDTEPMDHEMYSVSVTRPVSRSSQRNPRPQYKDNVVEPWGEVPVNRNFTFPIPDGIETVPDLYKAWHEGWGDTPSLFQLTKENGPSWTSKNLPSSKKIYDWYYAHYRVIRAVNDLVAKDKEWTVEKAIFALERLRGKKKLANLHKEIPRPGHMILPTEDKDKDKDNETPRMQSNSGSPAAADEINTTSSSKVAPTTRPSDLNSTAGGSTASSSRTGSSETVTSDHTATTSTASIVPSSNTRSINGQLKTSADGCKTPAAVDNTPTTKDKSTTSAKANSISSIVTSKIKLPGNDNNILNAKNKTTSNNNTGRRKSTTDSISTSSINDKPTPNVTTSAFNNTDNSHPNLTDDPIYASITTTSGLMNEISSVPVAKDTTTGSFEPSSPVDNTAVSRPKSATSGNITPSIKDETLGSPKPGPVDNTTAERPQSTVHRINTPGAIDKSTTSVSTANRITLAADSASSLVNKDRTPDISMAKVVNDTSVSKSKATTESSILLSTKGRITTLHTPALNGAVSKAMLSTDRNGTPITKDRPSGSAAPSTILNNTAVSPSNFITYTHNSAKSNQRATASSQISSRSSKEQPPEGLTQNGSAPSSSSGASAARSSIDNDAVTSSSSGSGVDRPNGMTASLNNDVTAGIDNRLKTASAIGDAKNVPNVMNTGIVQPPYSTNTYSLERPRSGSEYTVAPHGYVPRPKEQAETLHRRSRSGTEVTEILESGQVNSTYHARPPHEAIPFREAVPLPPSLQTLDQYPSSSSSMPQVEDERSVYYGPECYDDEDEQLVHKRPARQRPGPPSPVPPAQQPQQNPHHNRRLQQPHYPQRSQQPLRPTQHYQHYQRQLQRLHQEEQKKQYHQQQQQWNRSLDHTRTHPPPSPSQHPSFSSSSSAPSSSRHYDHNWSARHWKSSTYDEVIDLT